ncbi:hypothetical protein [Fluviicola taffensis]|uniref:hypothetical protein n=1 Tax=Fluviicola taffensis TaxID=191579 RepID=UPI0031384856
MKKLIYSILFFLPSCVDHSEPKVFELEYPEKQEKEPIKTVSISPEDTLNYDCTRSIPSPVLDSTAFRDWNFKLEKIQEGNVLQGIEYALLKSGNYLTIINSGCEYYSLTFEFTTRNYSGKTDDLAYWAKTTVSLLNEIKDHCHAPVDWETLEKELLKAYQTNSKNALKKELIINDSEIGTIASLEKVEQLDKQMVKISLQYSVGPL